MPTGPSRPRLPERVETPSPKPLSVQLEAVRERERGLIKKKKGYASTMATRPGGLGGFQVEKTTALGA